jgi:soluble P-type ATPase
MLNHQAIKANSKKNGNERAKKIQIIKQLKKRIEKPIRTTYYC